MRKFLFLVVCATLALAVTPSGATIIEINPGNVGDPAGVLSITSTEILGLPADGQTVEWQFIFTDMKYVELTNPFSADSKKSAANLMLDFGADFCNSPDCVPFQRPIVGTQIMYLTDMYGDPISGTGVFDTGVSNGTDTAQYNIFAAGDQNNPKLRYYGLYFNITLPNVEENGVPTITSANISLANAFSESIIGESTPVPEPSTIVLMVLGLVGLAGFCRRKSWK